MIRVLKASQSQFEIIDDFDNKGNKLFFYKDGKYDWITSINSRNNASYSQEVLDVLAQCIEIDYVPYVYEDDLLNADKIYLKIVSTASMTNVDRAKAINLEIDKIERPGSKYSMNNGVFPIHEINGDVYLVIGMEHIFRKHSAKNLTILSSLLSTTSSQEELQALIDYVDSVEFFYFKDVIPSDVEKFTHAQLFP